MDLFPLISLRFHMSYCVHITAPVIKVLQLKKVSYMQWIWRNERKPNKELFIYNYRKKHQHNEIRNFVHIFVHFLRFRRCFLQRDFIFKFKKVSLSHILLWESASPRRRVPRWGIGEYPEWVVVGKWNNFRWTTNLILASSRTITSVCVNHYDKSGDI